MTEHLTVQGTVWDEVSYAVYGDEGFISLLINANLDKRHIAVFPGGLVLKIPPKPEKSTRLDNLPPWKREGANG